MKLWERKWAVAMLIGTFLGLSSCNGTDFDNSNPEGTLLSAANAIEKNRLVEFRSLLDPKLDEEIGNPEGMNQIKATIQSYSDVSLSRARLLYAQGDSLSVYEDKVFGRTASGEFGAIYTAQISCRTHTVIEPGDVDCTDLPSGAVKCRHTPGSRTRETRCVITELKS